MNSRILCRVMLSVALVVAFTFVFSIGASAAPAADQKKFEEYRAAIKKAHGIDIKNYKQKLKGGRADAQTGDGLRSRPADHGDQGRAGAHDGQIYGP